MELISKAPPWRIWPAGARPVGGWTRLIGAGGGRWPPRPAHDTRGWSTRDIKRPTMVRGGGLVKVLDFGLDPTNDRRPAAEGPDAGGPCTDPAHGSARCVHVAGEQASGRAVGSATRHFSPAW